MKNQEIAKIFYELADFYEIKNIDFKPRAYRNVARVIESMTEDVAEVYKQGGLKALDKLPGVGQSSAQKIEQFLKTGKVKRHQQLKRSLPIDILELTNIEGVGSKMVRDFYDKLKIKNIKDLEKAARTGKIAQLPGYRKKTEQNIIQSIEFLKQEKGRHLLGKILPEARTILKMLNDLPEVKKAELAGSLRRKKETIGDMDFLAISDKPEKVLQFFITMPYVIKVYSKGPTKALVRLSSNIDADLLVLKPEEYGAAQIYFTGDKNHNIEIRKIAIKKGYKLSEYGLFKGKKCIAAKTEKEIYNKLGMDWVPPEIRTASGEIEAAQKHQLPRLVELKDIKADLHMHSNNSDGQNTVKEMALVAKKLGYQFIAMCDHTEGLNIAGGMSEKQLLAEYKEIDKLNNTFKNFKVIKSAELNISKEGNLDMSENILKQMDYVIAGIHSSFHMSKKDMTERIIKAFKNPYLNNLVHPFGRKIMQRKGYDFDFAKVLRAAKQYKVALEINCYMTRLDLSDKHIRQAVEAGVKLTLGTDSHNTKQLQMLELGLSQARRGWAEKKDILNTLTLDRFLKWSRK